MNRDLSPFFSRKSNAVVGADERATSSGGAVMQMLRQTAYGGRVVPVNPKDDFWLRVGALDRFGFAFEAAMANARLLSASARWRTQ